MIDFSKAFGENTTKAPDTATYVQRPPGPLAQPPAPADPFDMELVKDRLRPYELQIDKMAKEAEALEIQDSATAKLGTEMAGQARKAQKAIDTLRKEIVGPAYDFKRSVDRLANGYRDKCKALADSLGRKMTVYQRKLDLERRKAEAAAKKAADELQRKLDAEAKAAKVEPIKVPSPIVKDIPKKVRTETGTAYQHKEWKFEVTDEDSVPREYLMVDDKAIRQAVKMGVREIPGVKIFEKVTTRFRT